jgi:hypothetical protein
MTGAQFEIRIDGTPRTYRDRKGLCDGSGTAAQKQKSAQHGRGQRLAQRRRYRGSSQASVSDGGESCVPDEPKSPSSRRIRDDPECPGCKRTMRLVGRENHSEGANAEILTFECEWTDCHLDNEPVA